MNVKILSAQDLQSGLVVYLTSEGGWSRKLVRAAPALDAKAQDHLLQLSRQANGGDHVIEASFIDVDWRETGPVPLRLRERIRAGGRPTVMPETLQIAAE